MKTIKLERGESYVVFNFIGRTAAMRNSLCERAEMSADEAHDRIATLREYGWADVDA